MNEKGRPKRQDYKGPNCPRHLQKGPPRRPPGGVYCVGNFFPPAPADFDKAKGEKWTQVCRDLVEWGMMATADLDALRLYVDSIFIARKALQTLEKEGYYLDLGKGKSKRLHPAFRVYMEATKQERALYDQFGRTPLARTRLKVAKEDKPEVDKIAEIMAGNFANVEKDKRAKA
ncbi:MAG: phage terminase small subunit P27 family [Cyanobacteria bacterium HKST-UBA06]|nr:phage terminase small subunit P27 family [Cyanobacteria bacterium HKST-UBA06]